MSVKRLHVGPRLSQVAIHGDTVYTAGIVADDTNVDVAGQTGQILDKIDQYLKELPMLERLNMAQAIQSRENTDRDWLKRLIAAPLWQMLPASTRQKSSRRRLKRLPMTGNDPANRQGAQQV